MKITCRLPAHALAVTVPVAVLLSACASEEPAAVDGETIGEEIADAEVTGAGIDLEPASFANLDLGAKVVGPQGPTVTSRFVGPDGQTGTIESYVACPARLESCDPAALPESTTYTYVMKVTPDARASAFRTTMPVYGYAGVAGFDQAQAASAIGGDSQMELRCVEGGLFYSVLGGEGWAAGSPITFFWQGTLPPAGPQQAYQLIAGGDMGTAAGPAPARMAGGGCS
ncbi:hypothetical protein RM533_02760 [Croceicoccus sp. F390]|uniref:Lipoprotein n=1 Tax=Croceicoccus esteveae TaxID=3075597 RepID=A0ABU2ZFM9_9SPHN|nr:hypothetical protein [Croceicoccus sp. F390]MDT0575104.1 hypothetical protein [Croceicoccus sp. F390]